MRSSRGKKSNKKPPACDACKARRVLCHPQPNDLPCPRCAEKGVVCITTYVPRGRPRKHPQQSEEFSCEASISTQASGSKASLDNSLVALRPRHELAASWELPCELVKHLYECFATCPLSRFPLLQNCSLKNSLSSAAWNIDRLIPEARVLAYCICALASSISSDPAIIGPGVPPVFVPGADLRIYGVRRAPMYHTLRDRAIDMACEVRIHLEASDYNATSCFILDTMEESGNSNTRPWVVAYISHIRSLAASWIDVERHRAVWSAFLMSEALMATRQRKPILITHTDQLLLTGSEPPSLESLFESLQAVVRTSKKPAADSVFTMFQPLLFHAVRLAREFYDKISGDYARRYPVAEVSVITFLSSLSIMKSILSLLLTDKDFQADPIPLSNEPRNHRENNLRSCAFAMSLGYIGLVLALHHEMEYRAEHDTEFHTATRVDGGWAGRTALLQRQAHEMTANTVDDVARALHLMPVTSHMMRVHWSGMLGWAQFCLTEADAAGGVSPGRIAVFQQIIATLKALGYSRDIPQSHELIERMEAHIAAHSAVDSFPMDTSALSGMTFSLDHTWMGMFPMDLGYGDHT
ncbi:hypothetical protein DFH09DRAFT_1135056 [Mycena vulgaris]|nr:hypothetical protein DFH09DRAFT_1135056 [Mycena vulgaris]